MSFFMSVRIWVQWEHRFGHLCHLHCCGFSPRTLVEEKREWMQRACTAIIAPCVINQQQRLLGAEMGLLLQLFSVDPMWRSCGIMCFCSTIQKEKPCEQNSNGNCYPHNQIKQILNEDYSFCMWRLKNRNFQLLLMTPIWKNLGALHMSIQQNIIICTTDIHWNNTRMLNDGHITYENPSI